MGLDRVLGQDLGRDFQAGRSGVGVRRDFGAGRSLGQELGGIVGLVSVG